MYSTDVFFKELRSNGRDTIVFYSYYRIETFHQSQMYDTDRSTRRSVTLSLTF